VHTLTTLGSAFFSGLLLGRLAYLLFRDLRAGFPWLFGTTTDCPADQMRLLTASSAATIAAAVFAGFDGVSVVTPILLTPFLFCWSAEVLQLLHRAFGPAFEAFVLKMHPVDIGYSMLKKAMGTMWSQALPGRNKCGADKTCVAPAPAPDDADQADPESGPDLPKS
jgi:hypothetical protein